MAQISQKPLVFLDTETSGLDPQVHEILEICIMDRDGHVLLHSKVKPSHIETAHPKALEINRYTEAAWAEAPSFAEIAPQVAKILSWGILAGHNVSFDMGFIKAELGRVDPSLLKGLGYHLVDTVGLAYEHLAPCGLDSLSLINVAKFLRIPLDNAHTAQADTEACRQVYFKLARSSWLNRLLWKWQNRSSSKSSKAGSQAQ